MEREKWKFLHYKKYNKIRFQAIQLQLKCKFYFFNSSVATMTRGLSGLTHLDFERLLSVVVVSAEGEHMWGIGGLLCRSLLGGHALCEPILCGQVGVDKF